MAGAQLVDPVVLAVDELDTLIAALRTDGYRVMGPTVRDDAIVHGELRERDDLPRGWTDEQGPGTYRLRRRDDDAHFGYAVGPASPKRELFPPHQRLWTATSDGDVSFRIEAEHPEPERVALLGIRPCELAAINVQDRVLLQGHYADEVYAAKRSAVLLIAVECGTPAGTCFCASMGTGPGVTEGADLVLTELLDGQPRLLARADSEAGAALLQRLEHREATAQDLAARDEVIETATAAMGRELDTDDVHDLLLGNLEHPRWDDIAERCLACANCTLACPTCFCSTIEDSTDLTGEHAYRDRRWDSCFGLEFSHAGPASVRSSTKARYRQWMTHKLATWIDQFGTSGCVGCGRCITWCPVGIDITEEVAAIRRAAETSPT
ncbi:MAG: 4Fe-4S dicluster domain-containing protein [Nitriliruptoraceae bacterium]